MTTYAELASRLRDTAHARRIPVHASFCLTHRCNFECPHCYLRDDRGRAELDTAAWCDLVDQATELGCLWLTLTGGEPTLRRDFSEIYRRAKQRGLLVTVMTNGSLLDDTLIRVFAEWPPHCLDISLYAFERSRYKVVTGRDARDAVFHAVDTLREHRIRVRVKTTVTRENTCDVAAIAAWAKERELCFRVDGDLCPTLKGDRQIQVHRIAPSQIQVLERTTPRAPGRCGAAQTGYYVRPDGAVGACLLDTPLARSSALSEIWSRRLLERRALLSSGHPACDGCPARTACDACFALLHLEGGPSTDRCNTARLRAGARTEPHVG